MHAEDAIERLRAICMALPGATERLSHGEPSWFAGEKGKQFVTVSNHHHNDPHAGFWCPAPPGAQEVLVGADPERFYRPPYVGHRGWLGVYLDVPQDWEQIADLVREAYLMVAAKRLAARVAAPGR